MMAWWGCGLATWWILNAPAAERIAPCPEHPHYWSYKGQPVLLLGGSDEDNLFNHPDLMRSNLEALQACGGNYIRSTLSWRDEGNVPPYRKVGEKYDLERFNPEFWRRLEECLREAYRRDIIVQIEIWATFDYYEDRWLRNPFNPAMNVNYTTRDTHLVERWDFHPARKPQPFFHSPLNRDRVLLRFQEAFVRRVLEVSLPYPNVLYCLDNETRAPAEWALYWGRFIREEARRRGVEVQVTEMWDPWDLRDRAHAVTYQHLELFSFTDVSQNNWQRGETHYQRLIWFRHNLSQHGGPRPMNNVKIYGCERPRRPRIPELNVDRFWKCLFAGCASARFHRPPAGLGLNEVAQRTIKAARTFTSAFPIFATEPRNGVLREREEDEAYCLALPGEVYALYFPRGGEVRLQVEPKDRTWRVRWFDPYTASFHQPQEARGESLRLRSPDREQTWLVLVERM